MLITSLVLWLFDNSIFHCHLLCLMPLYTREWDGGGATAISGEKPLFDCVFHILFLISLHFIVSILHFIRPAPPCECPSEGLPVPVVEEDILINIFHLFSKLWAKIRRPPQQDNVTLVSPPGQSDTHTHRLRGGEEKREGWCRSNFSGLWADSSSTGRAGNHGGNNVYIDQLSGRFMASFCCNGELVGRLSATQHHRLLPVSRPGNLSLPRSKPNTCDSTSTCPNSIKRKCWN